MKIALLKNTPTRNQLKHSLFTILIVAAFILTGTGCSLFRGKEGTPDSKRAVLLVTNEYLTAILTAKIQKLPDVVAWGEYLKDKEGLTKEGVENQILLAKKQFKLSDHPLSNLIPTSIDVHGDDAVVVLKKGNLPNSPELRIEAYWGGGGWIVKNDNLFGPQGVVTESIRVESKA